MKNNGRIVYSINVEDLQVVAREELSRDLLPKELKIVEDKIGDYLDWHGAITSVIEEHVENSQSEQVIT